MHSDMTPRSLLPRTYPIVSVERSEAVTTFTFDVSFGGKPGQFLMVWIPGFDEKPLSIADDDGVRTRTTFFSIGPFTQKLGELGVGDLVGLRGAFGTHFEWASGDHIALVGGGYGAAPIYFVAKEASHDGATIEVLLGAKTASQLLYLKEFESLPNTSIHVATDDGSMGFGGYNTALLEKILEEATDPNHERTIDKVFACGPEQMLKSISNLCARFNVPAQLSWVRFVKSGYGAVGTSVIDPLGIRLSVEGPVLSNDVCKRLSELGNYRRDSLGRKQQFR